MKDRIRLRLIISIAVALVGLGCSDSLTPEELVGTYTLATIDNQGPPRLLSATIECDVLLVGGQLELLLSPDWSALSLAREEDCTRGGGSVSTETLLYLGRYWLEEGELTFQTQLSDEDTLRFSGPVRWGGVAVTLVVRDTIRGLGGPLSITFER